MRKTDTPKGERLVKILAYLIRNRTRRYTCADIQAYLQHDEPVDLRNVQRDLRLLASLRESCVYVKREGVKQWYGIEPDMRNRFTLPVQRNGLLALFLLKRLQQYFAPKASTLQQLTQALEEFGSELGDELFDDLDQRLGEQTRILGARSGLAHDNAILDPLLEALLTARRIAITYRRGIDAAPKNYTLCPAKMVLSGQELYLVAVFDPAQADTYYFKLCRIVAIRMLDDTCRLTPKVRAGIDQRLARSFGILDDDDAAVEKIVLHFPDYFETLLNEKQYHPSQTVRRNKAGDTVCTLTAPVGEDLLRWVMGWGTQVTVVRPASLRQTVAETARMVAERYRSS